MTATPKIELKGVKKRFGPKIVLDGVDLTINEGDSIVIIGGSGSGKSVTIKCVLGIIRADAGTIRVRRRSPRGDPRRSPGTAPCP